MDDDVEEQQSEESEILIINELDIEERHGEGEGEEEREETQEEPNEFEELPVIIRVTREVKTEHSVIRKFSIDNKFFCYICCMRYCHRNGKQYYNKYFVHEIFTIEEAKNVYNTQKCENCHIGLMGIFGRRDCPNCKCNACDEMNFDRCEDCDAHCLEYSMTVHRVNVIRNNA